MRNFKIKTKKDWCIAAVFATLIIYGISTRFSNIFQTMLLRHGNPMMTNMNQPKSYGNVMFTIVVMMIVVIIVLIKQGKPKKIMFLAGTAGIISLIAVFGLYLYNVEKIVSIINEEKGYFISMSYWADDDWKIGEKEQEEIIELCEKLEPVSAEEQKRMREDFFADEDYHTESVLIWTEYPEKYGHNFDLMVCVHDDRIYVWKGYDHKQEDIVTFFEDNGLVEKVYDIMDKNTKA